MDSFTHGLFSSVGIVGSSYVIVCAGMHAITCIFRKDTMYSV